jgi:hypothetical protein
MALQLKTMFAAALLSAFAAFIPTASAQVHSPDAYNKLTAVHQAPGQAPRSVHGASELSNRESRYLESLPMQLDGAIRKVKKSKYAPEAKQRLLPQKNIQKGNKLPKTVKGKKRKSLPRNTARDNPASL